MRLWRLVHERHVSDAYSGEGARLYGGRWLPKGYRVVYTSDSAALAVLEVLVHVDPGDLVAPFFLVPADVPDTLASPAVERGALPAGWVVPGGYAALHALGLRWHRSGASVALPVPSALVPQGDNWLLNPEHPDFPRVRVGPPERFRFDGRLAR